VYQENPFKRGSMKFDDYNYQVYNPYILVAEEKDKFGRKRKHQPKVDAELYKSGGGAMRKKPCLS